MGSIARTCSIAKPYLAVIFLQFGIAGLAIIAKFALNHGMNHYTFVFYRHLVATIVISPFAFVLERNSRPTMTLPIFVKIVMLGLLEPVLDQNLYYAGLKYTTATFVSALSNIVPALAFLLAWIFRLEKVNIKKVRSLAKVVGTLVTVGGATIMTLVKGPVLKLTKGSYHHSSTVSGTLNQQNPLKGAIMVAAGCVCWAGFIILQAVTLKSYPAEMSLTAMICIAGTIEGGLVALAMEWGNTCIWSLHIDSKLLAYVYSGIVCSGIAYYVQGVIMKKKGPVFVTAFSPLSMIIVAFIGSILLGEQLSLGRIIGAVIIVTGLYAVIWGKNKDQNIPELEMTSDDDRVRTTNSHNATETTTNDPSTYPMVCNNTERV
ncbi:WAT1-related protein At2g39510-like isoform X1 [Silene latifolia]|uniref:WAT1-related protein At2g39510-like isoform X1 n=2 Tax=Silene latifolia TaxID=37657 RepID=UPI003D76AD3B